MAAKFKVGAEVRQVMPAPVTGTIVQLAIVEGDIGYLVQTADGLQRWFNEDQLEAQAPA